MRNKLIAAFAAGATIAAPAAAQAETRVVVEKNRVLERLWEGVPDCEGFTIAERYRVRRTIVEHYDDDGNLVRETINVHFDGTATNESTGGSLPVDGTRRMVFDYQNDTFTETGVLRHVTQRGEGIVLHEAGRIIEDLEDWMVVYFKAGPKQLRDGDLSGYCAALARA